MFAHQLTQLAALAAIHGRSIIDSRVPLPDHALDLYWTASKCRQERWARTLKTLAVAPALTAEFSREAAVWVNPLRVLEEVLETEVLSRIWAAVCTGLDRRRGREDAGPIAGSVLAGHFEARHRVLNLIVGGYGLGMEEAVELNRRRVRAERRTDMLLSLLGQRSSVALAFDAARVRAWVEEMRGATDLHQAGYFAAAAAIRWSGADREGLGVKTANEDLNHRIAASVVACFPAHLIDSSGLPLTPLHRSLLQVVSDVPGAVKLAGQTNFDAPVQDTRGWYRPRGRRGTL